MKDLTKIYIDLSKCTEEQRKHIVSLLPKSLYLSQYKIDKYNFMLYYDDDEFWVNGTKPPIFKTELTYPEFIKLFEGGDDNNGWIKIESEADLPKETIECRTCFYDGKNYVLGNTGERNSKQLWNAYKSIQITHYQPIQKPLPPKF